MTNRAEILATSADFVRTGSDDEIHEKFEGWIEEAGRVDWQTAMKRSVRDPRILRRLLNLPESDEGKEESFGTFVPLEFLSRMRRSDQTDPLLMQVLPRGLESSEAQPANFISDPVGDLGAMVTPGLLHKYHGRALLVSTGACGVHCRYCFRREFPYSDSKLLDPSSVIEHLRSDATIEEVLLSGGDPLTLRDDRLVDLIDQIESIEHVRRLRFHSRMPIVIPNRLTETLISRLASSRLSVWFVVHVNHANEWGQDVGAAVGKLIDVGIPVLNQSVLLRGVNDHLDALVELSQTLVNDRVTPYYLHQLDRVRGAAHFEVSTSRGAALVEQMRKRLPGYAVPQYVTEQPGRASKTPVSESLTYQDG